MYPVVLLCLAVGVVAVLVLATRNANLLFKASVRQGKIVHLRGRAPKQLVSDLQDVLSARPVAGGGLRVVVRDQRPFLHATGDVDDRELQRLRNVLGTWGTAKIRSAPYRSGRQDH